LDRLLQEVATGSQTVNDLRSSGGKIVRERNDLEDRLAELEEEEAAGGRREALRQSFCGISERWPSLSCPEKRALLERAVERITVFDDRVELSLRC